MCNIIFEGVMALFNDEYVIKRCVLILYPGGGGGLSFTHDCLYIQHMVSAQYL